MNAYVHYTLTKRWALEVGFDESQAEEIARFDVGTDRIFPGNRREYLPYHWLRRGAMRVAEAYLARAMRERDVRYLGVALHAAQDAIAHGPLNRMLHWPGIDIWRRRRPAVQERLAETSREIMRRYLAAVLAPGGVPDVTAAEPTAVPDLPAESPWPA